MEDRLSSTLSSRDVLYVIFGQKTKILVFFFATFFFAACGAYLWPPSYEAESQILIKLGRENASIPPIVSASQPIITLGVTKEVINSERQIITSKHLASQVVDELGLDYLFPASEKPPTLLKKIKYYFKDTAKSMVDYIHELLYLLDLKKKLSPREKAVSKIQEQLSVTNIKNSDVISIKVRWSNPVIASELVNTLVNFYLIHRIEIYKNPKAYDFFADQTSVLKEKLSASEEALRSFKAKWSLASLDEQKKLILRELSEIRMHALETNTKNIDIFKGKLVDLELKREDMLLRYSEDSRIIKDIESEIMNLRARLDKEIDDVIGTIKARIDSASEGSGKGPAYAKALTAYLEEKGLPLQSIIETGSDMKEVRSHPGGLSRNAQLSTDTKTNAILASLNKELQELDLREIELNRLKRQLQIDEDNYRLYVKKMEESRISNAMDSALIDNVSTISPAIPSFEPVKPRKLMIIGLGSILGLFGGLGMAFFMEFLNQSIRTPEEVDKYIKLPLLGSIKKR